MFGLFKKQSSFNSPEEKLQHDMRRKIENLAMLIYNKSDLKGTAMGGYAMIDGINQAEEFYSKRSIAISEEYNVSRKKTINIINDCARYVYKENINY